MIHDNLFFTKLKGIVGVLQDLAIAILAAVIIKAKVFLPV